GGAYAYIPKPDGGVEGFDFDLLAGFAQSLGLELSLSVQKDIAAFFKRDGVLPPDLGKAEHEYTPDLLKRVDLYANPWGVTPWRERLMKMVTIYPIRNQLAGRKGEEVRAVSDLGGKRFAVIRDSVQHKTLDEFARKNGLSLAFVFGEGEDALYDLVRRREADFILDGSVVFALNVDKLRDFGLSPFFSELQGVAWATKREDPVFASILESYLEASRRSGLLPALWTKTFKMDFRAYVDAMTAAEAVGAP
ncbi:MAG: transporter substrate-binding domain-containing protein, partial [Spirochaetaceae bacterium]|nr:transporter substrate-binding domain-containing protein [Spirochaetaceae bacterium]